jgi:AcrR family transcriptional regulator
MATPKKRSAGRPSDLKEGEIKSRIRQATIKLIGEKGYDGTSIAEIAGEAGITKPMVYYYYESKANLLIAILEELNNSNIAAIEAVIKREDLSAGERVRLLLVQQFERVSSAPEVLRFFHRLLSAPPKDINLFEKKPPFEIFLQQLTALAQAGIKSGEFTGEPAPIGHALLALFQHTMMMSFMGKCHAIKTFRNMAEKTFAVLLNGIATKPQSGAATP